MSLVYDTKTRCDLISSQSLRDGVNEGISKEDASKIEIGLLSKREFGLKSVVLLYFEGYVWNIFAGIALSCNKELPFVVFRVHF